MTIADWTTEASTNEWNSITLNGTTIRGPVISVKAPQKRNIDVKSQKGKDGATYTDNGVEPSPVDIEFRCFTTAQADEVAALLETINPRVKGNVAKPVSISHPVTTFAGIQNVIVKSIGSPTIDKTSWTVDVECVEYTPVVEKKPAAKKGPVKKSAAVVGYQTEQKDKADVKAYYDQQFQQDQDDYEAGRISAEELAQRQAANDQAESEANNDLNRKYGSPAEKNQCAANSIPGFYTF
jgi:hypothetical protein